MRLGNIKNPIRKHMPLLDCIIFESHPDFSDNSRALFDYLLENGYNKKYRLVWLVEDPSAFQLYEKHNIRFIRNFPTGLRDKMIYTWYVNTSKFGFFCHRMPQYKPDHGEIFVNLWHGSGLKKPKSVEMLRNVDYLHSSSSFFSNLRVKNYGYPEDRILPLGNPRCDYMLNGALVDNPLISELNNYDKRIMWLPTFHKKKDGTIEIDTDWNSMSHSWTTGDARLMDIDDVLRDQNMLMIIKPHPMEDLSDFAFDDYTNIRVITPDELQSNDIHLYYLLGLSHALITDISSVYTDYLLMDNPIAFTVDNVASYHSGYHVSNPLDYMPGHHLSTADDMISFIHDLCLNQDPYGEERRIINELFNLHKSDFCERIIRHYGITMKED